MSEHPETGRDESDEERLDRNLSEFLQELRVALPGVQVLFAFLLIVPFNDRFVDVTDFQKSLYFATLLCAFGSSVCLIAPTIHHRIQFRDADKERILRTANRLAIAGLVFLAVALSGVLLLVTDLIYGDALATIAVGAAAIVLAVIWFWIPLRRRQASQRQASQRQAARH